jgi:hypothetical protein
MLSAYRQTRGASGLAETAAHAAGPPTGTVVHVAAQRWRRALKSMGAGTVVVPFVATLDT